jgi:glycerophosphoryl diester phosphodiesterase
MVEIDVVASRGRLGIAHDRPLPLSYGMLQLRSVAIDPVWRIARSAPVVELDLKQSSPLFVEALVEFLGRHRDADVLVATPNVATLRAIRARAPWARRFLSVTGRVGLERALHDPVLVGLVHGVSVRHDLLDAATTRGLKERGLTILAWVVDDPRRTAELVRFGVDGITTNNLAMIELLGRRPQPNALSTAPARSGAR